MRTVSPRVNLFSRRYFWNKYNYEKNQIYNKVIRYVHSTNKKDVDALRLSEIIFLIGRITFECDDKPLHSIKHL